MNPLRRLWFWLFPRPDRTREITRQRLRAELVMSKTNRALAEVRRLDNVAERRR